MFRPMLSATLDSVDQIHKYPMLVSPKLDGIRATIYGGQLLSRNGKLIPNVYIRSILEGRPELEGLDGELIVGLPYGEDTFLRSTSGVMSRGGTPDFTFWVFDKFSVDWYQARYNEVESICSRHQSQTLQLLPHRYVLSKVDVDLFEAEALEQGYEGIMIRSPHKPYKMGRSTLNEQGLMKLKRFKDSEAEVIGVEERMHNANEATIDSQGYIERSKHKENMIGRGDLGALLVRDLRTGIEFSIGTGFDDALRRSFWLSPPVGRIITYKYFPIGQYDKPRFPVFKGIREDL